MADLRIEFEMWLAERQASKNSPNFCVATIVETSRYAIEKSVSKCELFAITDHRLFNEIKSKLLGNKFFRITRKNTYKAFEQVANLYVQFLKDLNSRKIVFDTEVCEIIDKEQQIDVTYISEEDEAILPISKTMMEACNKIEDQEERSVESETVFIDKNFKLVLDKFKLWLIYSGKAETTMQNYWNSVRTVIRKFPKEWMVACKKEDLQKTVIEFIHLLKINCEYNERNNASHNQWKSGLNAFLEFIQSETGLTIGIVEQEENINNCKENKTTLVAQIIDLVKKKGISGASVDKDIFPFINAKKRAVWDILNTNEELIEVPRRSFVFKDEITDLDEAREVMLRILRGHFSKNNGVSTSKILYKAVQAQLPVFLNDNDFDDEEKVYCIAKYLYSKCGSEHFGFYMN